MDQSTINAWHELGDAYIDAYEERTGKDLQENDIQDRAKNVSAVGIKITTAGGDDRNRKLIKRSWQKHINHFRKIN